MPKIGFSTERYLQHQVKRIKEIINQRHNKLYIEFGGKIVHDRHAARVLPGYDENTKVELIRRLCRNGEPIFVVSAKDILRGRVRGDFKITYDHETFRVIKELASFGLHIKHVVISMLEPGEPIPESIKKFEARLKRKKFIVHRFYAIEGYPAEKFDFDAFQMNPFIETKKKIVLILSPGGGSGKFGICLSQLYHELVRNNKPYYLKFETFPVHDLSIDHPLNLAFMAASADFYDVVMKDKRHGRATSYNRDLENFELLRLLMRKFPHHGDLKDLTSATGMGINMLTKGILDDELVQKEAAAEIARRLIRYKGEVARGEEKPEVVKRVRTILSML